MVTKVSQIVQVNPYRPNFIINGSMDINQRQISGTNPAAVNSTVTKAFGVDRFSLYHNGLFTAIVYQNIANGNPSGSPKHLLVQLTSTYNPGANEFLAVRYAFEEGEVRKFTNKDLVLSFDVIADVAGEYCVAMRDVTGNVIVLPYTINTAGVWERKEIRIPPFSFPIGVTTFYSLFVEIFWVISAGANVRTATVNTWSNHPGVDIVASQNQVNLNTNLQTFHLTGVRLEEGTTASDYFFDDLVVEFNRCQRYYQKTYSYGVVPGTYTSAGRIFQEEWGIKSTAQYARISFPQRMRVAPNMSFWSVNTSTLTSRGPDGVYTLGYAFSPLDVIDVGVTGVEVNENGIHTMVFSQAFAGNPNWVSFHYTADSEL